MFTMSPGLEICENQNKAKDNNETLSLKVWRLTLFGLQSILSLRGATRTLCGRRGIYRSAGRAAVRLNCKQVPSRDHGRPSTAHPERSDSSSLKGPNSSTAAR